MRKIIGFTTFLFLFSSCVGVVEDAEVKSSVVKTDDESTLTFDGIEEAIAVSNRRIEVYFRSVTGGSGDYSYVINIPDYSPIPFMVSEENLRTDFRGRFQYTVILDETATAKSYSVSVNAQDDRTDEITATEVSINVKMFANKVANYSGVLGVENLPGVDGLTKLKVLLGQAHKKPSLGGLEDDPVNYEIILIEASKLLPPDMDNSSLSQAQGRYVFVVNWSETLTEHTLVGLPKNTAFYVRSRVVHRDSIDDPNDEKLRSELNNIIFEASTFDDSAAAVDFDAASFTISKAEGEAAKTSVRAQWNSPSGIFDHLRIYWAASPTTINLFTIGSDCTNNGINVDGSGIYCKRYESDVTSTQITGLAQETLHTFQLVICLNNSCSVRLLYNEQTETTSVNLPGFNGIQSLRVAENINEIGKLFLRVVPPDISQSFYDGYIIRFSQSPDSDPSPVELEVLNPVATTLGSQNLEPFDYLTATEIVVDGVSYNSGNNYCYKVNLFNYDALGSKVETDNNIFECATPSIVAPTVSEFSGITSAQVSGSSIIVNWLAPTAGVFEYYEIFYTQLPSFSFNDAIVDTTVNYTFTNYQRKTVLWTGGSGPTTLDILHGLANGTYRVGIITYYSLGPSVIRSEFNGNIFTCTVVGAGTSTCTGP